MGPKCLCLSKHLCGPACDLAIDSLERVSPSLRRPPCAIATCCHYLCTWETFSGKKFWETMSLTEQDFVVAVAASQWASVNKKQKKATPPDSDEKDAEEPSKTKLQLPRNRKLSCTLCRQRPEKGRMNCEKYLQNDAASQTHRRLVSSSLHQRPQAPPHP